MSALSPYPVGTIGRKKLLARKPVSTGQSLGDLLPKLLSKRLRGGGVSPERCKTEHSDKIKKRGMSGDEIREPAELEKDLPQERAKRKKPSQGAVRGLMADSHPGSDVFISREDSRRETEV